MTFEMSRSYVIPNKRNVIVSDAPLPSPNRFSIRPSVRYRTYINVR